MNPYTKHRENLLAAKERFRKQNGAQPPKKPFRPYAMDRPTSYSILKKRVALVRDISEKELENLIQTRKIQPVLGVQNAVSISKNRAIHTVLAAAGKVPLKKQTIEALKSLKSGVFSGRAVRHEPYVTMLEIAGIVEVKKFRGGRRAVEVIDKGRLERSIREGKIIW